MTDSPPDEIDERALALLRGRGEPRRRARPRLSRALYDAEDRQIPVASGEVAAWRLGDGPAVLLVHGWEDDQALWGPAIDGFVRWGRPVVAMDLPGHGVSSASDASIRAAGEAVLAVARAMGPIEAVVGHSYGCAALIYALSHGLEVGAAVLIATPVPRTNPRRPLEFDDVDPEVLARAEALRTDHGRRQAERVEASIRGMRARALVVHSIDDDRTPLTNGQALAELWPGAELMLADGLGHRLVAQDSDVIDRVIAFVEVAR
jgi:pimeloyl-ACP methyl ester carboxylesterase